MKRLFLRIIDLDGEISESEMKLRPGQEEGHYAGWGVTAIGCSFELADGSFVFIHPKSVKTMKQYWKEVDA